MTVSQLSQILRTQLRFLSFRAVAVDLKHDSGPYFAYIIAVGWLVGIGRYWDHPNAQWWQYAGLGSIAYMFVLSAFLYVVVWPLRPKNWSPDAVFVFVGLTALPGLLYAIPVERFMSLNSAQAANAWFLGVVAIWRVALYVCFLARVAKLSFFPLIIAMLLPLSAIVSALAMLNLEHVVFELMAGIREDQISSNDMAYDVVFLLSALATLALPVTAVCYVVAILLAWRKKRSRT